MSQGAFSRTLPLWAALLPLVTINICYLVAIAMNHLPACVPYISGCTSVSSTGRLAPESWVFRAGMLPWALVVWLFWRQCALFLNRHSGHGSRAVAIAVLGTIGPLFLLLYIAALGVPGDDYRLVRRIGIDGFALSNFVAQVLFVIGYGRLAFGVNRSLLRWLVIVCLALPALAAAAEVAKSVGVERHMANNIVAWNAFLLSCWYFVVIYRLWQHHDFPAPDGRKRHSRNL